LTFFYYFEYHAGLCGNGHETDLRMMCVIGIDDRTNACKLSAMIFLRRIKRKIYEVFFIV
jgi:hypothetical protein